MTANLSDHTVKYVNRWHKGGLADWLIEHGTIYPTYAGLLAMPHADLVAMVLREMREAAS